MDGAVFRALKGTDSAQLRSFIRSGVWDDPN